MKSTYTLFFLLFTVFIYSCGGGTNTTDATKQAVEKAANKASEVAKEMPAEKVDMSAPEVIKKRKEMDMEAGADLMKGSEYNAPYICVDHCKNSGSAAAGNCRTCGKAYVKNENFVKRKPPGY